jgi:hypothetical protein
MKVIPFAAPVRLFAAMPLIFGLATVLAASSVQAAVVDEVNIINGLVDVDQNGAINASDDRLNVWLWCNDAAPVRVRIIDGGVDVTESGFVSGSDDLINCDLNDENSIGGVLTPTSNPVDIINGCVDVNESGVCDAVDDATNVKLFTD